MWEKFHQVLLHCVSGPADSNLLPSCTSVFPCVVIRIVLLSNCLTRVNEATRPPWRKEDIGHWFVFFLLIAWTYSYLLGGAIPLSTAHVSFSKEEGTWRWFIVRRLPSFSDPTLLLLGQVKSLQRLPALHPWIPEVERLETVPWAEKCNSDLISKLNSPLPTGFITLLLINPLCSNYSSLTYMIADCCHRTNFLSCKVGINLFYRGVKEFERLSFVLFQFHGENTAKLSRSCPISSERAEMSWARQRCRVKERGSPRNHGTSNVLAFTAITTSPTICRSFEYHKWWNKMLGIRE